MDTTEFATAAKPRKHTVFSICTSHAGLFAGRQRTAEVFCEGGPATAGSCTPGAPCKIRPGSDLFDRDLCVKTEWTLVTELGIFFWGCNEEVRPVSPPAAPAYVIEPCRGGHQIVRLADAHIVFYASSLGEAERELARRLSAAAPALAEDDGLGDDPYLAAFLACVEPEPVAPLRIGHPVRSHGPVAIVVDYQVTRKATPLHGEEGVVLCVLPEGVKRYVTWRYSASADGTSVDTYWGHYAANLNVALILFAEKTKD